MLTTGTLPIPRAHTEPIELQPAFDVLPRRVDVRSLSGPDGRTIRYVDTGEAGAHVLVFFGGIGTSAGACLLTEFAATTRRRLGLRLVCVERTGLGGTSLDPSRGHPEAAQDARAVLAAIGAERYGVVAFSGGAPYAAALAAAAPRAVASLHLAAAAAGPLVARSAAAGALADAEAIAADPAAWWEYPPDSPTHAISGFGAAAAAEGWRALGRDGRGGAAVAHEWRLLCEEPLPDLGELHAPAYLYWGDADGIVPPAHAGAWELRLPCLAETRAYRGEGHDVQYRHWDQILFDAAGLGERTLMCRDGACWLVRDGDLRAFAAAGASLGLCPWAEWDAS